MAGETKIEIKVGASTGAAQEEFSKLTAKARDQTEAMDAAGKGLKGVARELANTKAAQIEASEAVRRAKSAQEEHNLTVGAFGPKSAQAKASADQLAKATKAQAEAAEKAAKSLDKTTKAVVEAAKAEGDQLSPATIRATKQVEALGKAAEKSAQDLRKTELASKQQSKGFDLMGMAGGKLMGILGPAALGGSIIALGGWLGEASQKTFQYETALANLPFSLDGVTKATHGMIDQQTLVASASSAVALGVTKTSGEFEALGAASVKLAAKLGQPADALLNNLVTALGRGSTELLDNAGIVLKVGDAHERYAASIGKTVEQLTNEEKAVAFKTEAFKAILASADKTTVSFDSNAAALVRLKTTAGNAWDSIERGATNAFGAVVAGAMSSADHLRAPIEQALKMQEAADLMNRELMRAQGWSQGFKDLSVAAGESALEMLNLGTVAANFQRVLGGGGLEKAIDGERQKAEILTEEAKQAERLQRAMERIEKSNESFLDAQAEASLFIGPMPAEKPKKTGGKKKKKEDKDLELVKKTEFRHDESDLVGEMFAADLAKQEEALAKSDQLLEEDLERKTLRTDRELELMDIRGEAEVQHIDRVFWAIDRETEAGAHREALINQQLAREAALARSQVKNARNDKAREEAQTKLEVVEHKKRMAASAQAMKQQERDNSRKVALFETTNGAIMALGETLVTALWARAEGEKGAVAHGLAELAKGTSKKLTLIALEQTVLGVAAASGVFTAAAAAPHFAAAAIAAAGAVVAGGAGVGLDKMAAAKGYGSKEDKWQKQQDDKDAKSKWQEEHGYGKPGKNGSGSGGGGGGSGSGGGGSDEGGDDDGIPTSYVERSNFNKRNQPTSPRKEGGGTVINNTINGTFLGATEGQVFTALKRGLDNVTSSKGKTR